MKTINELIKEGSNPFQAEVIVNKDKELIVPAGAGSGKTKTLVTKMVELIEDGHELDSFLVLTFTKKSAEEMKERIKLILTKKNLHDLASKVDSSYVSTFDSFANNFVKQHASKINLDSNLEILDGAVFKIIKNEMMEELILDAMVNGNEETLSFIKKFTHKKSSYVLVENLINLYEKISNDFNIINLDFKDLMMNIKLVDKSEFLDEIRDISDEFYGDEKNQMILTKYEAYIDYLNGDIKDYPIYEKKLLNWKMFDPAVKDIYKSKIEKVIKLVKELWTSNTTREDILFVKANKEKYLKVLIDILKKFEEKLNEFKKNANKYEFNDISNFLNKILKENIDIRLRLKDQFKFIFVDEYQDTSQVQSTFLDMLIEDNNSIHVMYVGDLKQSIYKFRNAKPESFIKKQKEATVIGLNTNYRSHKDVIKFINQIFRSILNDENKYDINYNDNHEMLSGSTKFDEDLLTGVHAIEIIENEEIKIDKAEEAFIVGNKIKDLMDKGYIKHYSEVAILSRNTTNFKHFIDVFKYLGIPLQVQVDMTLNDTYLLKLMASILMLSKLLYVNDKKSFEIKRLCYLSLTRSELIAKKDFNIFNVLIDMEANFDKKKILKIEKDIYVSLLNINKVVFNLTNLDIVDALKNEFDIETKIISTQDSFKKKLQIDYLEKLCQPMSDLGIVGPDFIDYFYKIAFDDQLLKVSVLQESKENSVKITNIHQSKGLEYEVLFCVGLNQKFGVSKTSQMKYSNENLVELYPDYDDDLKYNSYKNIDSVYKQRFKKIIEASQLKEELRLLYVAFTRAEKALYLITTKKEDHSSLKSFADYLYEHNYLEYLDKSNIKRVTEYQTLKYYKDDLKSQKLYYPEKISKFSKSNFSFSKDKLKTLKASNTIIHILDEQSKKILEEGTKLHLNIEFKSFNESYEYKSFEKLKSVTFGKKLISEALHVLNEYEFIYESNGNEIHGVIDLLVIYEDEVKIIDFKTKDLDESKYYNQLKTYKEYIQGIYQMDVKTYLYGLITGDVNEVIIHD